MELINGMSADVTRQYEIMDRMADKNAQRPIAPLAFVDTYGCQQNEADSELLRGMLARMGYGFTRDEFEADLIVINTCAVREHAEMRVLGNVGALTHAKKNKPGLIVVLCGCMVQQPHMKEKIRSSYRLVDLVFGPHELPRFPELLEKVLAPKHRRVFAADPSDGGIAEGLPALRDGQVKAWLSVMYGCNNFCSYCVVPYVRGRERSRTPEHILADARRLVSEGCRDITLLGQNVNSYGRDLGGGYDFARLLEETAQLDGDFLIRFMTSHPKDATERLFETMARWPKIAKHIHLPFQAGSSRVLRAMNRGYTREEYLSLVTLARSLMPDIVLTSDVIVGFPGETEAEFDETLEVIETARFDALFTFIYSPRVGTPAAEMPDPFSRADKQRRFDRLIELQNRISTEKHAAYVGKQLRVLIDGPSDGEYNLTARTNGGRLVHLKGDSALIGSFQEAGITSSTTWALFGRLIDS